MRNSGILKWANNKNSKLNGGSGGGGSGGGGSGKEDKKKWIHAPDTLVQGHVVYLVKFLGNTKVDQPKGIEVVKQGIQKLKFNQQLKKSENGGNKTPKVELTISVDGVTIQEPKTKSLLHQYPLHRISYCADDKAEKRFFSFIAKEGEETSAAATSAAGGGGSEGGQEHTCFVFVSDKLAEEITLTIGQAFELAYKKFLDTSGKEMETKKQLLVLQKRIALLENENTELKKRLRDVANIKGQQDVVEYMHSRGIAEITEVKTATTAPTEAKKPNAAAASRSAAAVPTTTAQSSAAVPAPSSELICLDASEASAASAMDKFTLDDLNDDDFNPRAGGSSEDDEDDDDLAPPPPTRAPQPPAAPSILPPPQTSATSPQVAPSDIFARKSDPFGCDPFGMANFSEQPSSGKGVAAFADSIQNRQQQVAPPAQANNFFADLDPLKK